MGTTLRTAEEAQQNYAALMGEPLGSLFHVLWQEIAAVHRKWAEYVELFGTSPERINLLNATAPSFFRIVEDVLWEDILLHITRLTAPPRSAGKPNLTLNRLPGLITDPAIQQKVKAAADVAVSAAAFCFDWRNRRIAHQDLNLALDNGACPLLPASRNTVKLALRAIVEVLDIVSVHFTETTNFFDDRAEPGGTPSLLSIIAKGLKAKSKSIDSLQ